jgi:hypothetical protein
MNQVRINAVAYEEGDAWVAQGIEYDIVAHASDIRDLPDAFMRAVMENICVTEHLGRKPLQGIQPAPAHFRTLFESAATEMRPVTQRTGRPDVAVRLAPAA